jgi:hypothetical protein
VEADRQVEQPEDSNKQVETPLDPDHQLAAPELRGDTKVTQTYLYL